MVNNPFVERIHEFPDLIHAYGNFSKQKFRDFAGDRNIFVDLGSGAGNFLVRQAKNNPDMACFGIEIRFKRLFRSAEKTIASQLNNLNWVQCRINQFFDYTGPDRIQTITCNFPDPWPKKRHHKNRSMNATQTQVIAQALRKEGEILFRTDSDEYFEEVVTVIKDNNLLSLDALSRDYADSEYYREEWATEFEELFLRRKNINFLSAVKIK